jgi:hypothetical protein
MAVIFQRIADGILRRLASPRVGSEEWTRWNVKHIQAERLQSARMFYSPVVRAAHADALVRWRTPYEHFDLSVWAAIVLRDPRLYFDLDFGTRFEHEGESEFSVTAEWGTDIASRLFVLVAVDEYYSSPGHQREPDILPRIYSVSRSDVVTLRAYLRASVSEQGYILGAGSSEDYFASDPRCLASARHLLRQNDVDFEFIARVLSDHIQAVLFPVATAS